MRLDSRFSSFCRRFDQLRLPLCLPCAREAGRRVLIASLLVAAACTPTAHTAPDALPAASVPLAARPPVPGAPAGVTAFVDVAVIPMDSARVLPHQTLLVERGWIMAVGSKDRVRLPAGVVRIDGRGKFLMPGLSDCHAHIGGEEGWGHATDLPPDSIAVGRLLRWLADGVTTIRNLDYGDSRNHGFALSGADVLRLRARAAAGELWSPRIYTSGQWGPEQYVWPNAQQPAPLRLDSIEAYLVAYKAAGYNFVKTHYESPEVFDSVLAAARRVGIPVVGHVMSTLAHALAGRMQSIEHMIGYPGEVLTDSMVLDSQARALAVATREAGAWNCVTMQGGGFSHVKLVKALQDAGAGLLLGSDFPLGLSVHRDLELLVQDVGLTPYEALATGTKNFGVYLRTLDPQGAETGTIAVGKRADLVLLEGNPLQEITNVKRRAGVMLGGRWFTRDQFEERLLAFPRYGLVLELQRAGIRRSPQSLTHLTEEQSRQVSEHMAQLRDLSDSLVTARSQPAAYKRVVEQVAAELGAMRTILAPEQHAAFDEVARVWLRAQARQGHHVEIPGVAPGVAPTP